MAHQLPESNHSTESPLVCWIVFSQGEDFKSQLNIGSEIGVELQLEIAISMQRRTTEIFLMVMLAVFRVILRNIDRFLATVTMDVPFQEKHILLLSLEHPLLSSEEDFPGRHREALVSLLSIHGKRILTFLKPKPFPRA